VRLGTTTDEKLYLRSEDWGRIGSGVGTGCVGGRGTGCGMGAGIGCGWLGGN